MAANKSTPTSASLVAFLGALPDEVRRSDAQALVEMMGEATGEEPTLWGPSIVGFGSHHYKYESGREGDALLLSFSPRKAAFVIYGATGFSGSETMLARLGKHTMGKGCLYLTKVADVDPQVLQDLLMRAVYAKTTRNRTSAKG